MSFTSEELLEKHGAAIRSMAFEIRAFTGGVIDRDDLYHCGVEGMLDAARRYDPRHGVQFWTFAYPRAHGAMVDAVRRCLPLPPRYHRRLAAAEAALRGAVPDTREHVDATQRVDDATVAIGCLAPEALAIQCGETLGVHDREEHAQDDDGSDRVMRVDEPDVADRVEAARCGQAIHAAMGRLTVEERMILRGIFFEERPLHDLAAELGISISWVSRIHTRALGRLKEALEAEWGYEPETARPWVRARRASRDWIDVALEADASGELEAIETDDVGDTDVATAA